MLLFSLLLASNFGNVAGDEEEPNVGELRLVSFHAPSIVPLNTMFSANIDVQYSLHGRPNNATIRTAIYEGEVNYSNPLWESDPVIVTSAGDKVWNITLTSPPMEGYLELTAYAYYFDNGAWIFHNSSLGGPGFRQITIQVAKAAVLNVDLGVPGVPVTIDNSTYRTSSQGNTQIRVALGAAHAVSVTSNLELPNSTRLIFNGWKDGSSQSQRDIIVSGDMDLVGTYGTQYLLQVNSPFSSTSEWYDVGAVVKLQQPSSYSMSGLLGLLGSRYDFVAWSGDINSTTTQLDVVMNAPKSLNANFSTDYHTLVVPVVIALGLGAALALTLVRYRGKYHEENEPSDFAVSCIKCGESVESGWAYCIHCGAALSEPDPSPQSRPEL